MRLCLVMVLVCAACGGASQKPDPDPSPHNAASTDTSDVDDRSPMQVRQEAACEQVGRRATKCAIEDTSKQSADVRAQADVENTAAINTREYVKKCVAQYMSSRQIRVFEVCLREESECDPFFDCLDNANAQK
jgi:hypothetical protein